VRTLRLLMTAALLYGSGAQWAAAQTVAWAGMVASRAPRAGLAAALRSTFDGAHPCGVCLVVAKNARAGGAARAALPSVHFIAVGTVSAPAAPPSPRPRLLPRLLPPAPRTRPASPPPKPFLPA
jgi:hypothetical protein